MNLIVTSCLAAMTMTALLSGCSALTFNPDISKGANEELEKFDQDRPPLPVHSRDQLVRLWRDQPQYAPLVGGTPCQKCADDFRCSSLLSGQFPP